MVDFRAILINLYNLLHSITFSVGETTISIISILQVIICLLLVLVLTHYFNELLKKRILNKIIFEKMSYEIDSRQILMKLNAQQGMPVKWELIKKVDRTKEACILTMSKAQFIYLPFKIFNTENERKFLEAILRRKGYLQEQSASKIATAEAKK